MIHKENKIWWSFEDEFHSLMESPSLMIEAAPLSCGSGVDTSVSLPDGIRQLNLL